jgi:hypothetical protein
MLYVATAVIIHDGTQIQFIVEDNGIAGTEKIFILTYDLLYRPFI